MHQPIKRFVFLAFIAGFTGCGKSQEPTPGDPVPENGVQVKKVSLQKGTAAPDVPHQTFSEATVDYTPPGEGLPPDKLHNGKISGKLYEAIVGADGQPGVWEQIRFVGRDGKPLQPTVTLKTDLGEIAIELWPDLAPNHVRNFLALCQVGYYDGMTFHQTQHQEFKDETGQKQIFDYLEAGCPLGTGAPGYGHIGYWLRSEVRDPAECPKARHEEGTLGAVPGEDLETTACKFYITLSKVPRMDGRFTVFGKVTRGLDVARTILSRPGTKDDPSRPQVPVVIRAATIRNSP